MLNWKLERIRYAPDKLTLVFIDPADPSKKEELHLTFEVYQGAPAAVARIGKDVIWFSRIMNKPYTPPS